MKKGFTLVELLVVIMIIGLIGVIGIVAFKSVFSNGEANYYDSLESNIKLAGSDYYVDHRDKLPNIGDTSEISLGDLVESNYIDPVLDSNGNVCTNGKVYAYKENGKYVYEVCLLCDNYQSDGKYCKKFTLGK